MVLHMYNVLFGGTETDRVNAADEEAKTQERATAAPLLAHSQHQEESKQPQAGRPMHSSSQGGGKRGGDGDWKTSAAGRQGGKEILVDRAANKGRPRGGGGEDARTTTAASTQLASPPPRPPPQHPAEAEGGVWGGWADP